MKLSRKQTIVKSLFSDKNLLTLLTCAVFFFIFTSPGFAPTKLTDDDLADVEAQSSLFQVYQFTNASLTPWNGTDSQNIVRLSLNIDLEMMSHMQSFKLGYYNNGSATGWDQDTTNYFWGDVERTGSSLVWHGLFIDFGFDNLTSNTTRTLNYIEVGTMSCTGQVTGTINTINGMISDGGTGQNNGVLIRQTATATRTIHFNNEIMSFIFATRYRYQVYLTSGTGSTVSGIFIKIPNYDSDLTT